MGANKDKKRPPRKRKAKPAEPLTDAQKEALSEVGGAINDALVAMGDQPISREFSIVRTKLEEAEMWLDRGFEELGYDLDVEEDDEEDDDEEPGDDAEEGDEA
jgi:hypothetical protein